MMFWRIIRRAMLLVICSLTVCGIASCEVPAQGLGGLGVRLLRQPGDDLIEFYDV